MHRVARALTGQGRRRGDALRAVPNAPSDVPALPDPTEDAHWLWLRDRVRALESMREVHSAEQECQVAVAHLTEQASDPGPVGKAVERALHRLALDVHHECRRIRSGTWATGSDGAGHRPSLAQWLQSPVDSGDPIKGDLARIRAIHYATVVLRFLGAAAATVALLLGSVAAAGAALVGSVLLSGTTRYWTNAESASTFRARYFSCFAGHLGDVMVTAGAALWLYRKGLHGLVLAPLAMIVLHLLGVSARLGALGVGVLVPRLRSERLIRLSAMALALALAAIGIPSGFLAALAVMVVWFLREAGGAFVRVWEAGATEFAWTTLTEEGFTSDVVTAPHPADSSRGAVPDVVRPVR